jgi:preprotein translocase subunit SecG
MVLVILLQKSEGGGMSGSQAASMFGGALTGASAGNFFTKLTAWLATIFFVICACLALTVSRRGSKLEHSDVRDELVKAEQESKPKTSEQKPSDKLPDSQVKPASIVQPADTDKPAVPEN